jgi:hypothetical protein
MVQTLVHLSQDVRSVVLLLLAAGASYWYCDTRYTGALAKRYPDIWRSLGSPRAFHWQSIEDEWKQLVFLLRRKFKALPDEDVRFYGNLTLASTYAGWILFLYLIFLLAANQ